MSDQQFSVPDALTKLADLYRERGKVYGDNYKLHGFVMRHLFPNGVTLLTVNDHNRFGVFTQIVCKLTRYANMWDKGGHADSVDDMTVYAQMLQELDAIIRAAKGNV